MESLLTGLTRQELVAEFLRSPHGDLASYRPVVERFAQTDPAFLAHAMVWGKRKGTIRDAVGGMPLATLTLKAYPPELRENSLALLAMLDPRSLLKVWEVGKPFPLARWGKTKFLRMIHGYLKARETCWPWWERTALHYRGYLKTLYRLSVTRPSDEANAILFRRGEPPAGSIFATLQQFSLLDDAVVAGTIRRERIPVMVCEGVLGSRIQEPAILAAVLDIMTPAQIIKRRRALKRWGAHGVGATRGALTAATARAADHGRKDTLLTATAAAQALVEDDPSLAVELEALQEAQLQASTGIEGNWLIGGDRSPSMEKTIDKARMLAGYLAKRVSGQVLLVFFDREPLVFDVTGKSYADIGRMTAQVQIGDGTCIGCVPAVALERKFPADGIALVSDGGERIRPLFHEVYAKYSRFLGKEPPVYLYKVQGLAYQTNAFGQVLRRNGEFLRAPEEDFLTSRCQMTGIPYQVFPIADDVDQYGLGTLAETMRVQRYDLYQEIMETPLLTLAQAFRAPRAFSRRDYALSTPENT